MLPSKAIVRASLAMSLGWYDAILCLLLAPRIATWFFGGESAMAPSVLAPVLFAFSFAARPVGAALTARMARQKGPAAVLPLAVDVIILAALGSALLTSWSGPQAGWIFLILRLVFGLGAGAAESAAMLTAAGSPAGRRGLASGLVQAGAGLGVLLAIAGVCLVECLPQAGAWAPPALLALPAILGVAALLIGRGVAAPPAADAADPPAKAPILKTVLLALLGLTCGAGVVLAAGWFYSLYFLGQVLKVPLDLVALLAIPAAIAAVPLIVFFGWLSDRVGRKWIIMAACALAALSSYPLFNVLTQAANPQLGRAAAYAPVVMTADLKECSFQFDPSGLVAYQSSCDVAKSFLTRTGIPYRVVGARAGELAFVQVGDTPIPAFRGQGMTKAEFGEYRAAFEGAMKEVLRAAGYPASADPALVNKPLAAGILFLLALLAAMVLAPVTAMLAEMAPSRNRAAAMNLPYQIGLGWVGGLLPCLVVALVSLTGNIYFGLIYPIAIAALSVIVGAINLKDTKGADIEA